MTRITRPVARLVDSSYGPLVVTVTAHGIIVRRKGTRTAYGPIAFGSIYQHGAELHAKAAMAEKQQNRKSRVKRGLLSTKGR